MLFVSNVALSQLVPLTKKTTVSVSKHGIIYEDENPWLELMDSEAVINWKNEQNTYAALHFAAIKKKWSSASKIKEYNHYSSNPLPHKKGKFFYSIYRTDNKRPASLFYSQKLNDNPIEIVNSYKIYKDGNARLTGYSPSVNSLLLAVEMNKNGIEIGEIRFFDIDKGTMIADVITNVKSDIKWNQEAGVFYKKNSNVRTFEKDSTFQLFYHEIGTDQKDDALIYDSTHSGNYFLHETSGDKLIIRETDDNRNQEIYYHASLRNEPFVVKKFLEEGASNFTFRGYKDGRVYFSDKKFDWG